MGENQLVADPDLDYPDPILEKYLIRNRFNKIRLFFVLISRFELRLPKSESAPPPKKKTNIHTFDTSVCDVCIMCVDLSTASKNAKGYGNQTSRLPN